MKTCPCCSGTLLRYARQQGVYWFCSHCRQEMPDLASVIKANQCEYKLSPLTQLVSRQEREVAALG